ncbi:MAG TPA: DUF4388 domain-containing protein [Polyangiaceae bacterium]|nr:DUF4388 domain-containing protein [Polyangiaceae bacterium]
MSEERTDLVRVDGTGTAHPVGRQASQWMRSRQGTYRLMPGPSHLVFMRHVGEDGVRDEHDGAVCRLAGEITSPGAICDIVSLIGQAAWKGELIVMSPQATRTVYFDNAQVISASSTAEGERLGEVLYRYGALTREQVDAAAKAVTGELRFGEAAVKLGFISREKLFQLMARQTEEVVYAVLLVSDGMFYFLDNYEEGRLTAHLNLSVGSLLMEGVRRMDETRYFRERVPSELHVPARVAGRQPPESEELRPFYDAIDGQHSIADLCRVVGQGEFEVTHAIFQLVQSGSVVVHPPRPTGPAAKVARFNEAASLLLSTIDDLGRGPEIRDQLASFATGAGIYDALFMGAGPAPDGTLDVDRIGQNIQMLAGPGEAGETMLSQWLYEYASFGLFVAEPILRTSEKHATIARKVGELIAPLAPK